MSPPYGYAIVVAGPEGVAGLIHGLLKIQDAGERDEAGRLPSPPCAIASPTTPGRPIRSWTSTAKLPRPHSSCCCRSWGGSAVRKPSP